jgi:hypothetical protein
MIDYTNKIVIIEHPSMYDRHVVANVIKQTDKTMTVIYWSIRQKKWSDNPPTRRNIGMTLLVGTVGFVFDLHIQATAETLINLTDKLTNNIKENRENYLKDVKALQTK